MWPLWIILGVALPLAGLGLWAYRRYGRKASGRDDRYTPERILTPEQVHMLDYLRDTFPDQVVLPNMQLKDMLSVRRSSSPQRAKERLRHQRAVRAHDGRLDAVLALAEARHQLGRRAARVLWFVVCARAGEGRCAFCWGEWWWY